MLKKALSVIKQKHNKSYFEQAFDNSSIFNYNSNNMKQALSLSSKIRSVGNTFLAKKLKEYNFNNLVTSHGDILYVLYNHKKLTMKDIANKIHKTKATVTVLIDKLEKENLVKREKSAEDSRITYIVLTQKSIKLESVFKKIADELNTMLYKNFTDDEAKQLDMLLEKMLKNT